MYYTVRVSLCNCGDFVFAFGHFLMTYLSLVIWRPSAIMISRLISYFTKQAKENVLDNLLYVGHTYLSVLPPFLLPHMSWRQNTNCLNYIVTNKDTILTFFTHFLLLPTHLDTKPVYMCVYSCEVWYPYLSKFYASLYILRICYEVLQATECCRCFQTRLQSLPEVFFSAGIWMVLIALMRFAVPLVSPH